ncbi:MAG: dihydrofolate reductase family protein [Ectothiorhodospiraceae bacterium]|nr:dihydrofolate reductase family protein [Ectothiorhodospiraceae bacterium]
MTVNYQGKVQQILPEAGDTRPLRGLYLEAELPCSGRLGPYVYGNFVTTMDGRISLMDGETGQERVPGTIADPRDWRLFQELAARADVLLTSGRYLRDLKAGTAQDILPLGSDAGFADIHAWRARQALSPQPDIAVISSSLEFRVPELFAEQGRQVHVLTTRDAPGAREHSLRDQGANVLRVGAGSRVAGDAVVAMLGSMGYRRVYSVTGPWGFHSLVEAGALDSLFLTWRQRLVGGTGFSTILSGPPLSPPADFSLHWMYRDLEPVSADQLYLRLDRP